MGKDTAEAPTVSLSPQIDDRVRARVRARTELESNGAIIRAK